MCILHNIYLHFLYIIYILPRDKLFHPIVIKEIDFVFCTKRIYYYRGMFYVFSRSSERRKKRKYGRIVETNPSEKLTVFALMVCTFIIILPYRLFVQIR